MTGPTPEPRSDSDSDSDSEPGRHQVFLVRHGETEWTIARRHTGRTDIPLTDTGREEAKLLGDRLAGHDLALVLTSPLSRARETCELADLGTPATVADDLREWDYGDYEGRTTADIREERPGWRLFTDGVPHGETPEEVARRADRVVAQARAAGGDVALFAHSHLLRVLAARWVEQPPVFGARLRLSTTSISILAWEREVPVILSWNDTSHLRAP